MTHTFSPDDTTNNITNNNYIASMSDNENAFVDDNHVCHFSMSLT